ncbi:MAG: hypothetical protein A3H42_02815, partial [Deltaproteobacteria bacterium RIFCSPLOWO2_02_FULL_46_8]
HQDVTNIPHSEAPKKVDCSICHADIAAEHSSGAHHVGKEESVSYATGCTECHGIHNILPKSDKTSPIYRANIPLTCKKCHLGVFNNFSRSAHGKLWAKGEDKGPVCITCHKAHNIENVFSKQFRTGLPEECGRCHEDKAPTYKDTFHGQATSIGYIIAAKCSDCHTAHLNLPESDPDSTVNSQNRMTTCGKCHPHANANFVQYDPHPNSNDKTKSPVLFHVSKFMFWLLASVFLFFGIHTLLWLQRLLVAMKRGEIKRNWEEDHYIVRFDRQQRITHILVILSFLGLAATGIPLKYHEAPWAQFMSNFLGGVEVARYFHRLFAVLAGVYVVYHLYYLVKKFVLEKHSMENLLGNTVIPRAKDLVDLFQNVRWFLYLGERPQIGRWSYWEKFDYFAIFWGIPVIGLSGLILWFPEFFTRFLPGTVINLAMVIHSEEALLAIGFIFIFHFFHSHLRPENFPLDPVIFTGRIPLERFMEERPEEYEALRKSGELENLLVGPPSETMKKFAKTFGYSALTIGIILIVFIFVAFFTQ